MDTTADALKNTFSQRKQSHSRRVFQEVADIFTAFRLSVVADKMEAAEQVRLLRQDRISQLP